MKSNLCSSENFVLISQNIHITRLNTLKINTGHKFANFEKTNKVSRKKHQTKKITVKMDTEAKQQTCDFFFD